MDPAAVLHGLARLMELNMAANGHNAQAVTASYPTGMQLLAVMQSLGLLAVAAASRTVPAQLETCIELLQCWHAKNQCLLAMPLS